MLAFGSNQSSDLFEQGRLCERADRYRRPITVPEPRIENGKLAQRLDQLSGLIGGQSITVAIADDTIGIAINCTLAKPRRAELGKPRMQPTQRGRDAALRSDQADDPVGQLAGVAVAVDMLGKPARTEEFSDGSVQWNELTVARGQATSFVSTLCSGSLSLIAATSSKPSITSRVLPKL